MLKHHHDVAGQLQRNHGEIHLHMPDGSCKKVYPHTPLTSGTTSGACWHCCSCPRPMAAALTAATALALLQANSALLCQGAQTRQHAPPAEEMIVCIMYDSLSAGIPDEGYQQPGLNRSCQSRGRFDPAAI